MSFSLGATHASSRFVCRWCVFFGSGSTVPSSRFRLNLTASLTLCMFLVSLSCAPSTVAFALSWLNCNRCDYRGLRFGPCLHRPPGVRFADGDRDYVAAFAMAMAMAVAVAVAA